MNNSFRILYLVICIPACLGNWGCSIRESDLSEEIPEGVYLEGEKASNELIQTLKGRLREVAGESGLGAAMEVCSDEALQLTVKVAQATGVEDIKRVGVRVRNPENAPDPLDLEVMGIFGGSEGEAMADYHAVRVPETESPIIYRYYKPIFMQEGCLKCHGPEEGIDAQVSEKLQVLYPEDEAVNFEEGQLRGMVRVEIARMPEG